MIIRNMTAWFGALEGKTLSLSDGLNILYAPNESGKSTWCAFIRAMLYGLDTAARERNGQKPDKLKYQPWSGAPMSGSMDVEADGSRVTLRRWTDRPDRPMQGFSAALTGTDAPVGDLTAASAGETLTGMPAEVFDRSVFIRQAGLFLSNEPALDRRISSIASSGEEDVSFLETQQRLKEWQRRRSGRRGAIAEQETRLAGLRERLDEIAGITARSEELDRRAEELAAEYDAALRGMEQARSRQRKQALADMSAARVRLEKAEKEAAEAEAAYTALTDALAETPFGDIGPEAAEDRWETDRRRLGAIARACDGGRPSSVPALAAALLALLAFLLSLLLPGTVIPVIAGAALLALCAVLLIRLRLQWKARNDMLAERERILSFYDAENAEEAEAALPAYRRLWQEMLAAGSAREDAAARYDREKNDHRAFEGTALHALDFSAGDSEAARLGREAERLRAELSALREKRALLEGRASAVGDRALLEAERDRTIERLRELKKQDDALTLALDTLTEADLELRERYSPRLAETAAVYFSRLTGGRYDEVTLSRGLEAKARLAGDAVGHDADHLSLGAKDQLYLALRLAVCTLALPADRPCPIILDDALVNFDHEREERAMALLRELADERQILLFTCTERLLSYFTSDAAVDHRHLLSN